MVDNKPFLARVYELYGTDEPVALAPLLGYKSANAVRNLQRGKNAPGETVLLRIKLEKGEDLTGLAQPSGAGGSDASAAPYGTEQGMHRTEVNPEVADLIDGIKEILDSGVESVITALRANIRAFRLSARALQGKVDRRKASRATPQRRGG